MKVQKRKVVGDHTVGYKVSGKWMTRPQVVKLAEEGKINGVTVCGQGKTQHIRSLPGTPRLYDLDVVNA